MNTAQKTMRLVVQDAERCRFIVQHIQKQAMKTVQCAMIQYAQKICLLLCIIDN